MSSTYCARDRRIAYRSIVKRRVSARHKAGAWGPRLNRERRMVRWGWRAKEIAKGFSRRYRRKLSAPPASLFEFVTGRFQNTSALSRSPRTFGSASTYGVEHRQTVIPYLRSSSFSPRQLGTGSRWLAHRAPGHTVTASCSPEIRRFAG